jgi:hypothetical protein
MTVMIKNFKGRILKDRNYHIYLGSYILAYQKFNKKPFNLRETTEALRKRKTIERISIKIEKFDEIVFNITFYEPQSLMEGEIIGKLIELNLKNQALSRMQKNEELKKEYAKQSRRHRDESI